MGDYRLYCLDGAGKIHFADDFKAESDHEAVSKAAAMKPDAIKCEVWEGQRLVASFNAD